MNVRRLVLIAMLVLGVGMLQPRHALAATITGCPTTEAALSADITSAGSGGTVSLICSAATTISFASPITINQDMTIDATRSPGAITLDGGGKSGLFIVNTLFSETSSIAFTLAGLTLAHASNAINDSGTLTVIKCVFYANSWAISSYPVYFEGPMTITDSTFSDNSVDGGDGGAIYILNVSLTISGSTFSGNSATGPSPNGQGGAIYSSDDSISISNSTFSGNSAGSGGAIEMISTDTAFTSPPLTITDSTFSGNAATNTGPFGTGAGAIDNAFGSLTIGNTIIAHSTGGNCSSFSSLTDLGHNLTDANGNCGLTAPTDLVNTDPQLDPRGLQNNGGPTPTIALSPGSPAIDAGPATCTPNTDQRGVPRPQGRACDIGAYESPYTQLITNGGFEHGLASWGVYSLNPLHPAAPISPHSGRAFATLCGYVNCLDALWQTLTVPASFGKATLSVWLDMISGEPAGSCNDTFYVLFLAPNGSVIPPPLGTCGTNTHGWLQASGDVTSSLAPYKGQQVTLLFLGTGNATLPTSFSLDDVSLVTAPATAMAGAAGQGMGTPTGPLHPVAAPRCIPKPHGHTDCTSR